MKGMRFFPLLIAILILGACGEYQRVRKSSDPEYKLEKAIEYFNDEDYEKAYPLFNDLLTLYRGSHKAAEVYYYFAQTSFFMEDYILAAYHYKNFLKTFPNHIKAEEASYKVGYCYYEQSPVFSLDQTYTYKAINELQGFINSHPGSDRLEKVNTLIDELRAKLERKDFEKSKLYFETEHFQAAVVSFNNMLSEYPDTKYRERTMYLKTMAAYRLASKSVRSKQLQRYIESRTAFREFKRSFPESHYMNELEMAFKDIESTINNLKNS